MKPKVFLLFTSIALISILELSCKKQNALSQNEEVPTTRPIPPCQSSCLSAESIGLKHNEVLSFVDNGMTPNDTLTLETLYSAEKNLIKNYFQQNLICNYISSWVDDAVTKTNDFYLTIKNQNGGVFSRVTAVLALNDTAGNRLTRIRSMNPNAISFKEEKFIREILDSIKNIEIDQRCGTYGSLSESLEDKWKAQNFDTCRNEGYISRIMISTMSNSFTFWINYPYDLSGGRIEAIPLWAALDIVGAVTAGLSSIASDILNGNDVNWANAGVQALLWGAGSSVVGTRWFKNLFK
ncbi:MAG TPA: hypothetical protein V6C58_15910 [Allocoleopsis sp.]